MELRKWLDENRAYYMEAMKILRSPKKVLEWLKTFALKAGDIMRYDPYIHDATAAIGTVCSAKERFEGVFDDIDFIVEYEDKDARFKSGLRAIGGLDDEPPAGAPDSENRG